MAPRAAGLSPLALIVLALLDEDAMYPYRMQQLIRDRGMDGIVNVRHRASLYQTIARLERDGLVRVRGTTQAENRPERTVYQLTRDGRKTIHAWLRQMLGTPAAEYPEFPAALSFVYLLTPERARTVLTRRAELLDAERRRLTALLRAHAESVPRLFMLETEYLAAITRAELTWVRSVAEDLVAGRLDWNPAAIRRAARSSAPGGRD